MAEAIIAWCAYTGECVVMFLIAMTFGFKKPKNKK